MKRKSTMAIGVVVFCFMMMASGVAWCADNGTVKVNGLVWLKDAKCLGSMNWDSAGIAAANLSAPYCWLTDGSKAGDWRLPTIAEAQEVILSLSSFKGAAETYFWTSTIGRNSTEAWFFMTHISPLNGQLLNFKKSAIYYVWPVRKY